MKRINRTMVAFAMAIVVELAAGICVQMAQGAESVSLSDAARKPTHVYLVHAGEHRQVAKCRGSGRPSDVQAYRRDGGALGPQISSEHGHVFYWKGYHGYVMYVVRQRMVTNGTHRAILFAIWCEG